MCLQRRHAGHEVWVAYIAAALEVSISKDLPQDMDVTVGEAHSVRSSESWDAVRITQFLQRAI